VEEYRLQPWGLYMARPTPGREQFHFLESWLLPGLGLRASVFHFNPGHERDQDFYIDIGRITPGTERWESEDLYLDLVVRTGRGTELLDAEELLDAHRFGLLSTEAAEVALRTAAAAIAGLAAHDHDLNAWLAGAGMELAWR
jgi:predicted RNA-binding protein associated with RNAse of E/G family